MPCHDGSSLSTSNGTGTGEMSSMIGDAGLGASEAAVGTADEQAAYAKALGIRLRAIRTQQGLSLHGVEEKSRGRWKAVVVGSYERGDRAVTVQRLADLADFYGVPVAELLPDGPLPSAAAGFRRLNQSPRRFRLVGLANDPFVPWPAPSRGAHHRAVDPVAPTASGRLKSGRGPGRPQTDRAPATSSPI